METDRKGTRKGRAKKGEVEEDGVRVDIAVEVDINLERDGGIY
jgi:hypothetical protein